MSFNKCKGCNHNQGYHNTINGLCRIKKCECSGLTLWSVKDIWKMWNSHKLSDQEALIQIGKIIYRPDSVGGKP